MCQFGQARATTVLLPSSFLQHLLTDSCTAGPVKWAGAVPHLARASPGPSHSSERGCQFTPLLGIQTEWVTLLNGAVDALTSYKHIPENTAMAETIRQKQELTWCFSPPKMLKKHTLNYSLN